MATTEKELDEKRQRNERLREQLAAEEAKRLTREAEVSNDVTAKNLDAEAARLEAQLAAAKETNKVAAVKSGAAAPIEAAQAQLDNATAFAKAEDARRAEQERLVADAKAAQEQADADAKAAADKAAKDAGTAVEKDAIKAKLAGDTNQNTEV